jgi:hypothetical protein
VLEPPQVAFSVVELHRAAKQRFLEFADLEHRSV